MIQRYPIGIQDFGEIRNGGFLYIDKTEFVYNLAFQSKYYFLSRPRRFGKSLLISTLESIYRGKKELFKGLYIEDKWDWSKTFPVIRISFSNIGHKLMGLEAAISNRLSQIAKEYGLTLTTTSLDQQFKELIHELSISKGKVVILIDEYDKPIIDYIEDKTEKATENKEILKIFYSVIKDADPLINLVFITGISKFSKVSIFSDLNNLQDLTTHKGFAGCCGITEEELKEYFKEELQHCDKAKVKEWYNGYSWDTKVRVHNPFSILSFFSGGYEYKNFWFETGTPTFLVKIAQNEHLYDFDNIQTTLTILSSYDLKRLEIVPLLFQTGYLTLKSYDPDSQLYTLTYPNREVKRAYLEVLLGAYLNYPVEAPSARIIEIRNALNSGQVEDLKFILNSLFKSLPYELWQKENENFYHAIIHLSFSLLGVFIQSEVQTANGRMDSLVQTKDYIYCFEFKLDGSADKAIQQIKEKEYLLPYANDSRKKIAIGLSFSSKDKKVEELKWEEL